MKIEDSKMDPYYIDVMENNHTVLEKTGKEDKEGKEIVKTHGYYSSVGSSLSKISKLLAIKDESTISLEGYITKLKTIKSELLKLN